MNILISLTTGLFLMEAQKKAVTVSGTTGQTGMSMNAVNAR